MTHDYQLNLTPVGYAAWKNKLNCLDAISSIPGVDLSLGNGKNKSAMCVALDEGHVEAAKILARKGAACTYEEEKQLGNKFTDFHQVLRQEQEEEQRKAKEQARLEAEEEQEKKEYTRKREEIREWMENGEFAKLHEWLQNTRYKLEGLWAAGAMPVVGWLRLADVMKNTAPLKGKLEAELDENATQREQVAAQIRNLLQTQQELESKNNKLQQQMARMQQITMLESESGWIGILCQKEVAAVEKVRHTMQNEYFMEHFDAEDVSTLFSMFNMDRLFARVRENDPLTFKNLDLAVVAPVERLQSKLQLEFGEAVELRWKLSLIENGEEGVDRHLNKCSICKSTKIGALLREYGMQEAEGKEIEEKLAGWKGYFLVTVNPATLELGLPPDHDASLTSCLMKIRRRHQWKIKED